MPKGIYKHKLHSKKTKIKMSNSHKGKKREPYTEETKRKLSDFWKRWWTKKSKEEKAKATEKCRQFNHTPQANQKRSESRKKQWAKLTKGERREHCRYLVEAGIKAAKKRWANMAKEERNQVTQAFQKAGQEAIHKKIARMTKEEKRQYLKSWLEAGQKAMKAKLNKMTKEERLKYLRVWIKAGHTNPSSIEKMIWKVLDELSIDYKTQISFNNGKFIVDIYIPSQRLIIECNGDYWHNYKIFPNTKIRDKALEKYADDNDYKLTWLWESDIRKNPKSALVNGLKKKNFKKKGDLYHG